MKKKKLSKVEQQIGRELMSLATVRRMFPPPRRSFLSRLRLAARILFNPHPRA